MTIVAGVFKGFIGQPMPLLEEIDASHALQPDRRTAAFALRMERSMTARNFVHGTRVSIRARNFSRRGGFCLVANSA